MGSAFDDLGLSVKFFLTTYIPTSNNLTTAER